MAVIDKTDIEDTLRDLNSRYAQVSGEPQTPFYFSKLALLELCGWIEVTMDSIIQDYADKYLLESNNLNYVSREVIGRTYGFDYNNHFRPMLIQLVGLIKVEEIERTIDFRKFELLKSSLGSLKTERDGAAHTYIQKSTRNISAPSATLKHFINVYDGLTEIDQCILNLNL